MSNSYFNCYTKRPSGDAAELASLVYRDRWRLIGDAASVLDVGCGAGGFMDAVPPDVLVRGVDSDPEAVAARAPIVVEGDAESIPFPDAAFDAIHAAHVIEHLEHPTRFVAECRRLLRSGGRLLVVTPDIRRYQFDFWVDHTHRHPFTEESLVRALQMGGFDARLVAHGLAPQTRLEELASRRLGLSVSRRYAVRNWLGKWLGKELVVVADSRE